MIYIYTIVTDIDDLNNSSESYQNVRKYMPKLLEFFDDSNLKIGDDQSNEYSFMVLSDLCHRSIAIESVIFVHNHLKYLKNHVNVSLNP